VESFSILNPSGMYRSMVFLCSYAYLNCSVIGKGLLWAFMKPDFTLSYITFSFYGYNDISSWEAARVDLMRRIRSRIPCCWILNSRDGLANYDLLFPTIGREK
jgi:hypothetical protein